MARMIPQRAAPHPLARFSVYLAGRHRLLATIAGELLERLDAADGAESQARRRASDLMWLRTLGAYEVARTMCQEQA